MKLVLNHPDQAPYEAGKDLKVMIVCEDAALARSAWRVLEMIGRHFKAGGRLLHQWWDFEVLAFNALRELAAVEARTADIVIIGSHRGHELPDRVAAWMKRGLELRKKRPGALVALLDSDLKMPAASQGIFAQLKQAAAFGHMDFFATRAKVGRREAGGDRIAKDAVQQFVASRPSGAPRGLLDERAGQRQRPVHRSETAKIDFWEKTTGKKPASNQAELARLACEVRQSGGGHLGFDPTHWLHIKLQLLAAQSATAQAGRRATTPPVRSAAQRMRDAR